MKLFGTAPGGQAGRPPTPEVAGDRGPTLVSRTLSMQSRVSNLLALGLMGSIGVGALVWYYGVAAGRPERARRSAQMVQAQRTADDTALPPLGQPGAAAGAVSGGRASSTDPASSLSPLPGDTAAVLSPAVPMSAAPGPAPGLAPAADNGVSPHRSALERELSGDVFATGAAPGRDAQPADAAPVAQDAAAIAQAIGSHAQPQAGAGSGTAAGPGGADALAGLLRAPPVPTVEARVLPTQRLLLPQGAFIDCTLETAIDSTLPGMTTCITATDTFSADGKVVLLERGTKLVGETRGEVQQGSARVFVLWTQARTPTGVIVPLDSPGTDELGRSGLPGKVDRHFWDRFGAAILISVIDGAVQAAVQSSAGNNGTVVVDPSESAGVLTDVLKSTVNIAPSVLKRNGDRIQVLVARDVDFTRVYQLRHVDTVQR